MADETKCLKCGAPLTADARDGVCPECWQEIAETVATPAQVEEEMRHLWAMLSS